MSMIQKAIEEDRGGWLVSWLGKTNVCGVLLKEKISRREVGNLWATRRRRASRDHHNHALPR